MKTISKVLLIIFFFIFSFINNRTTFDGYIQDDFFCTKKQEHHCCSIEPIENEGFIILPSNSSDSNSVSSVGSSQASTNLSNTFFAKNRYIVKNQYTISHLYKTEIFPNAP